MTRRIMRGFLTAVALILCAAAVISCTPAASGDKGFVIAENGECNYVIVAKSSLNMTANKIRKAIYNLCGKTVETEAADSAPAAYEILVGECERDEYRAFSEKIGTDSYGVSVVKTADGAKIIIAGGDDDAVKAAAEIFLSEYLPAEAGDKIQLTKTEETTAMKEREDYEGLMFEDNTIVVYDLGSGSTYPRMGTLADGRVICVFSKTPSTGGNSAVMGIFSEDDGLTWTKEPVLISGADDDSTLRCANAQPFQLADGTILVAYRANEKDPSDKKPENGTYRSSIRVMQSKDNGVTWTRHSILWDLTETGITIGSYGLWEPHLGMMNGELTCFFAIGKTVYNQDHIINSIDIFVYRNDAWVRADYTSTEGKLNIKNGMPVWCELKDGGYAVVVESNRNKSSSGAPLITKLLTSPDGKTWKDTTTVYVPSVSGKRAAAPYMVQLPDGRIVVSFQSDEDTPANMDDQIYSIMKIVVSPAGKEISRLTTTDFSEAYAPFDIPVGYYGLWNGMLIHKNYLFTYTSTNYPHGQVLLRRAVIGE